MRPPIFDAKILRQHLRRHKIATLTELKRVLDTDVDITVFRKLKLLDYRTSYTHRGSYYTLNEIAHFDDSGLWSHQAVWFSRYGTLLLTVEHFVQHSPRGFVASDLADVLHAEVHDALHQLINQERLQRTEVNGVYLYTAMDPSTHRRQLRAQRTAQSVPVVSDVTALQVSPDEVKASILLFYSLLDEQQRRLYAGLESIKLGRGGDTLLADLLDLEAHTVARGRQQLLNRDVASSRTRRQGGGRVRTEKTPEIISIIEYLLRHDIAGDPMNDLKWCRRTTGKIADLLVQCGFAISANTIARLLHGMKFSLRVNQKKLTTSGSSDRNLQFDYIADLRERFQHGRMPIISVDSKKRELVGNFKSSGARWDREAWAVNDHDFRSDAIGIAIPYGIYQPVNNRGSVVVGVSHDTSAFAAHAIAHWWQHEGLPQYPRSRRLLILADSGGSNGCRRRTWKTELQTQLADRFALDITVAHYPTGASKWNPIEHRLFSEISKNWAGEPLDSYQKILNFIRTSSTKTGLAVSAYLDRRHYPTGIEPSPAQLHHLRLEPHDTLPHWNYSIKPKPT